VWVTGWLRRYWAEVLLGLFLVANLLVVARLGAWETIPFHFIWVSLSLVFAVRLWPTGATIVVGVAVTALSGVALYVAVSGAPLGPGLDEMSEVPLMAAMFAAMVWHAHQRQQAVDELGALMEERRRQAERQREFVRDASHQLRTPITIARGHAELARARLDGRDPGIAADIDVVLDELTRLTRLSERLLLLASADDPRFLAVGLVRVAPLVDDCAHRWTPTADRAWRTEILADGVIRADQERLEIALDALIENAVKYTGDGDAIAIRAAATGDELVLEVSDSGEGIAAEDQARLFERFARVNGKRGTGSTGTGLGLPIVLAIAQAHGGTAEVESRPGHGATFRLRLPGFRPLPAGDRRDAGGSRKDRAPIDGDRPAVRLTG